MPRVTCGRATSAGTFIQPSRGRLLDVEAFLSHAVRFLYFTFSTLGSRLCNSFCMDHTLMSGHPTVGTICFLHSTVQVTAGFQDTLVEGPR